MVPLVALSAPSSSSAFRSLLCLDGYESLTGRYLGPATFHLSEGRLMQIEIESWSYLHSPVSCVYHAWSADESDVQH